MKKRILILCPFPEGEAAGQRLKYEQYFPFWREEGYEIVVSSYMKQNMWKVLYKKGFILKKILGVIRGNIIRLIDLFRARNFEVIYIHQWTTPFGSVLFDKLLRLLSKNIVFDLEDFVFLDGVDSGLSVNPIIKVLRSKKRTINLIKSSDYVITSSPNLNEFCKNLNTYNRSIFISSSIDIERFIPKKRQDNKKKITIGWTGTQSSKPYLDLLKQTLLDLRKEREFRFYRDKILRKKKFETIMDKMLSDYSVDIDEISKKLWMCDENLFTLNSSNHIIGLHSFSHPTKINKLDVKNLFI